jgi:hypothetical protein
LVKGVFNKRAEGLIRFGYAEIGLAHQFHVQRGQHGLQFSQLAPVVGCKNNFHDVFRAVSPRQMVTI